MYHKSKNPTTTTYSTHRPYTFTHKTTIHTPRRKENLDMHMLYPLNG